MFYFDYITKEQHNRNWLDLVVGGFGSEKINALLNLKK